jgi:hypothetical protein
MSLPDYVRKGKVSASTGSFKTVTGTGDVKSTGGYVYGSTADAITAYAGGGQASATLLAAQVNRIATVATAADSVKLPVSVAGMVVHVINGAASNSMQVFGSGTDTINDVATATGVAQAAGKSATYLCPVAGKWYRVLSA